MKEQMNNLIPRASAKENEDTQQDYTFEPLLHVQALFVMIPKK